MSEKVGDAAKMAQREYARQWRRKNPEKVRAINRRYWEKKAAQKKETDAHAKEEV